MIFGAMGLLGLPVVYFQQRIVALVLAQMARMGPEVQPVIDMMRQVAGMVLPVLLVLVVLHVVVNMLVGFFLIRRLAYHVCLVTCLFTSLVFPLGTVLGLFALVTLLDNETRQQFGAGVPSP